MRHIAVDSWSRRRSPLHARDARAKLIVLVVFLVSLGTTAVGNSSALWAYAALLTLAAFVSRLPLTSLLWRAVLLLPFSATFALMTWWSGDEARAWSLAAKAFLSALASLLLIGTTPLPELAAALEAFRVPRLIVLVIQFVYRYLFVIAGQAQRMRLAAKARAGGGGFTFAGATSALGVLFVRSWERAESVYSSMLARGFAGHFPTLLVQKFDADDIIFLGLASAASLVIRVTV